MKLVDELREGIETLSNEDLNILTNLVKRMNDKKKELTDVNLWSDPTSNLKETRFPIHNAMLIEESDYLKSSYFRCLAIALTITAEVTTNQKYLFNRLLLGTEMVGNLQSYIKKAYVIKAEQLHDFFTQIQEKELKFRFMIDFTVLLGCHTLEESSLKIIVEFCEALKIEQKEATFLFNISKCILTQDSKQYWELTMRNDSGVKSGIVDDYMRIDKIIANEMFEKASEQFRFYHFKKAMPLLQTLANAGYAKAYALLYWIYVDDNSTYKDAGLAKECLRKGFASGDILTTMLYALWYEKPDEELMNKMLPNLQKLVDQGDIFAEYTVGLMFKNGLCVKKDFVLAMRYFIKSYQFGFYRAAWSIFLIYSNGQDPYIDQWSNVFVWGEATLSWGIEYRGFEIANKYMRIEDNVRFYNTGDKVVFYKRAIQLWEDLIKRGEYGAATNLGWMYKTGRGTAVNRKEAIACYRISAKQGDEEAKDALKRLGESY